MALSISEIVQLRQKLDIDALYQTRTPFEATGDCQRRSWSQDGLAQPYNEPRPLDPLDLWYSRRPRIQRPSYTNNPNYNPESHYDYPPNFAGDAARGQQQRQRGQQRSTQMHYYDDPYAAQHTPYSGAQQPYPGTEPRRGRRGGRYGQQQQQHRGQSNWQGASLHGVSGHPRRPTYNFNDPAIKRILITKDPHTARSGKADGMGLKVIGGKLLPGTDGELGAYVAAVYRQAMVETMGQIKEGDQVLEWNGIPLTGRTYEEVQRIIAESSGEIEVVIRSDANLNQIYSMKHSGSVDKGYESAPDSSYPGNMSMNASQYQYEDPYSVPVKGGRHSSYQMPGSTAPPIPPHRCVDGTASPCFSATPAGPCTPAHYTPHPSQHQVVPQYY